MKMRTCKRALAIIWFVLGGLAMFLLIGQSYSGRYGERVTDAWTWLIPLVVPTASLVFSVYGGGNSSTDRRADAFLFVLSVVLSITYLLLVLLTIAAQPFLGRSPLELMAESNLWLAIFQSFVIAAVAQLFLSD